MDLIHQKEDGKESAEKSNKCPVRANHGSKSISLGNILYAYGQAGSSGRLEEFAYDKDGIELEKTYYFSYQISPELSQSAYEKTQDFPQIRPPASGRI